MGNRNTSNASIPFRMLEDLPTPLSRSQCMLHKHELLICGGYLQSKCYSYHTLKNEYKFICEYPNDVTLDGHCVVKLAGKNKNSNEITLLSFGGFPNHTLIMKYVSVWSSGNKINKSNNCNQWIPFTDNHNNPIIIERDENHYYGGVRAVIGGSNDHLLFITYKDNNISVFNLNTFQFQMKEKKEKNHEIILFCFNSGLSIEYDEDNNTFQFHQLSVCEDIAPFNGYAYVCINSTILFFGGYCFKDGVFSKSVYKYSIQENKWMTFPNMLPSLLESCIAILNEENFDIHIIGGKNDKDITLSTHMKTKVRLWDPSQLSKNEMKRIIQYWIRTLKIKLGWIADFDQIIFKYSKMK
ncbi:hypothetical protein RFI_01809 [Reticulomyxa filosa]|uniref:Kelch motif family protein n=1 Tax=Reticulomyxa filosa TaxID=46433 RepID=X6PAU7_RETFI|nr:hypothetical protein RFI_01809 [Reticulomyxa filosa]|eukprot:ETO35253.1 hypothetical protein RFI_01809 [Reticulomyxa filosa]